MLSDWTQLLYLLFSSISPWSSICFMALICMTCVWHSSLLYLTSTSSMYPLQIFSSYSCMNSLWNLNFSFLRWNPSTRKFCDIIHSYKLLTSQYIEYNNYLFTSKSFRYLLLAFAYRCRTWLIPPLTPVSTINNMLTSINNSNFPSIFVRHACHANSGADRKYAGPTSHISIHSLQKFRRHLPVTMYHSSLTEHDICQSFVFQNLPDYF